ncbi:unnamed protein product [Medioppia subpectinata]|uniref:Cytochrome P450 n=1 Tax=Medioppia subpectinata TaxID=1979941 RepID=A0A7R9KYF5_9ACAR|nr:unnamed protein product [Medioppia subpectinata]CAG2111967.1 unnamed protein product [Medioppia subpectinata]
MRDIIDDRYFTRNFDYWSKRGISGPKPIVGFGNTLHRFLKQTTSLEIEWIHKYGPIYGYFEGNRPVLTVADPELIRNILITDIDVFNAAKESNPLFRSKAHPILSQNLAAMGGRGWRRVHGVVSPTFSPSRMQVIYAHMNRSLDNMAKELNSRVSASAGNCTQVEMVLMYDRLAMDIITISAFGLDVNVWAPDGHRNEFVRNVNVVFAANWLRMLGSVLLPRWLLVAIGLKHPVLETANDGRNYNDFMDIVLRHKLNETNAESKSSDANYITENEILANSWVFFNSGCKIVSSALSFATYELARNQRIQQTLYEEIAAAVAPDGHIGMDALNKLPFLEAVVSESLRLHTVSIRIRRMADRDYRLGDTGITIEKGHTVDIPVHAMHHYEPYYPNYQHPKPYAYIPFSEGNRVCLAKRYSLLEIKTTLAKLVRRYRFYTTDNTDIPVCLVSSLFHHSPQRMVLGVEKRV